MQRFKNILFLVDSDQAAHDVAGTLQRAARLTQSNDARLTVVSVLEPVQTPRSVTERFGIDLRSVLHDRQQERLGLLVESCRRDGVSVATEVLFGTPFVEVIRAVRHSGFDLVIKAAQPPAGISERLFGSTDLHLLRKCPCPVWMDRPSAAMPYRNVLAAVDPEDAGRSGETASNSCARLVMDLASSLAQRESAQLSVVHAWRLDGESTFRNGRFRLPEIELSLLLDGTEARHRERLSALLAGYGLAVDDGNVHLVKGQAAAAIRRVAAETTADLIVMGTVGRLGVPGFFIGNTAEDVLQTAQASVLAVKPDGFVSPVA